MACGQLDEKLRFQGRFALRCKPFTPPLTRGPHAPVLSAAPERKTAGNADSEPEADHRTSAESHVINNSAPLTSSVRCPIPFWVSSTNLLCFKAPRRSLNR